MELLVFILVRHIPQLNTRVKESPSHVPLRPQRLPEESARLVANTVSILAELPTLCSPAGEARTAARLLVLLVLLVLFKSSLVKYARKNSFQLLFRPAGSMTILPTVLFLITGVLRETAVKAVDNSAPAPAPVSAALQGIKAVITSPLAQAEGVQTQWTGLVRSSLASVLEYSQPGGSRLERERLRSVALASL